MNRFQKEAKVLAVALNNQIMMMRNRFDPEKSVEELRVLIQGRIDTLNKISRLIEDDTDAEKPFKVKVESSLETYVLGFVSEAKVAEFIKLNNEINPVEKAKSFEPYSDWMDI